MLIEIIGNAALKRSIEIATVAARSRNEVLEHILLSGHGGLGKTHVLNAISNELGYCRVTTQGNRLTVSKTKEFLINASKRAEAAGKPGFFIIDEIHEMSADAQDELFYPMDECRILTLDDPVQLWPFCLAGATTDLQELDGKSLVDRFVHTWHLKELSVSDLMLLINSFYTKMRILPDTTSLRILAERSRGIPRLALKYARRARDFAHYHNRDEVRVLDVEQMFDEFGIDNIGLDENQIKYLTILSESVTPVGKETLASMLGEMRPEQLTRLVEPFLWKHGFIKSSNRGRELTEKGSQHIEKLNVV